MSESHARDLGKRNRLLCNLMWFSIGLALLTQLATHTSPSSIITLLSVGIVSCLLNEFLIYKKWLINRISYITAISVSLLSFLLINEASTLPIYLMTYYSLALISLYHDFRPILISAAISLVYTNYFFYVSHPVFQTLSKQSSITFNLFLIIITVLLVLQSRIGERHRDHLVAQEQASAQANDQLVALMEHVKSTTLYVASSAEELTATAAQTSASTEQIAYTMQAMATGTHQQMGKLVDSTTAIENMAVEIKQIASSAQIVSSKAIHASEVSAVGEKSLYSAKTQMSSIRQTFDTLEQAVGGLGSRSEEIGHIIKAITTISEQTNLLALNAAIEAARAGDQGRGFAVVADEVRKLAVQSSESAEQISQLVMNIQQETHVAMDAMSQSQSEVSTGLSIIEEASEAFEQIRLEVDQVVSSIQDVAASVEQISTGTEDVVQSIQAVREMAEESAKSTQQVSHATEEQLASMQEVASSANVLSTMADELQAILQQKE